MAKTPPKDPKDTTYALIDSGNLRKLERFGDYILDRPAAQAIWRPALSQDVWDAAHASFTRQEGTRWTGRHKLPDTWYMKVDGMQFKLGATDFGHLGIFPEQRELWQWLEAIVRTQVQAGKQPNILNLFAYSGAATIALARAGAQVCHLDAAKGMVAWARENAELNGMGNHPIRWIIDDAVKFLQREERRGRRYDGVVLHPPSFGRGPKGEIFKIEEQLNELMTQTRAVLTDKPLLVVLAVHTPELTPMVMRHMLGQMLPGMGGHFETGEMLCTGNDTVLPMPNGVYARWTSVQP